jgi:hypothetical protein
MFKNNVFNKNTDTIKWVKKAGIRAVKTFCQTAASFITVGAAINEVNWKYIVSVAAVAAVYSVVTSVAGLPEVEGEEEDDDKNQ